jgi:hypothetical protein
MFERFGEFDSAQELNKAAEGLKNEGDLESLIILATENGLDKEDAEDYMNGDVDELATPCMAALGKIKVESEELQPQEIMVDWVEYIKAQCVEKQEVSEAVRKSGKTLKGCIAKLLGWSFKNCYRIPDDISMAAGIRAANVKLGIPGMARAKKIIDDYYLS